MHLYIEQNTGLNETVAPSVVSKLYDLAIGGLDSTSDLIGTINTDSAAINKVEYLNDTFDEFTVTATTYTLAFEDSAVETLCVTNWGSNGGVTANQLAAVSSIGDVFKNNTDIVKFNEFKYFTNLGDSWTFYGCTNLREITMPANKNTVREGGFWNCSSLQSWDLSKTPTVSKNAFSGCSSCQFTNFSSLTSCGETSFKGCSALTDITIRNNAFLGSSCFENSGLQNVTFAGDFSTDNAGSTFNECGSLQSVTFEAPFSYVPFRMFRKSSIQTVDFSNAAAYAPASGYKGSIFAQCSNLITVTLSGNVNSLPDSMFIYSNLQYITIPANVTEIGPGCFYACRQATITCLPTTPPTLITDSNGTYSNFGMVPSIKVPAASLEAYKTATGWSTWASNITAIQT